LNLSKQYCGTIKEMHDFLVEDENTYMLDPDLDLNMEDFE